MLNGKSISLPDLLQEKKRNTPLSLSEGFTGAKHEGSLAATITNFCPRPGAGEPYVGQKEAGAELQRILPMYYRVRQMALGTEKNGHRIPSRLSMELRTLERALGRELRPVHPLFFQRFDDTQLDRMLRSMGFLRLSIGRWIFGSDTLNAEWPPTSGDRTFILLQGHVKLFQDPQGLGDATDIYRGTLFGEKHFNLGDETMRDMVAAAAHCEEPCMVGVITTDTLEAAYADRAFGNARIAQTWRALPSMAAVCKGEQEGMGFGGTNFQNTATTNGLNNSGTMAMTQTMSAARTSVGSRATMVSTLQEEKESGAVTHGLQDLSKIATSIHLATGQELLCNEPLSDNVLVVCRGALEVRGDITITEKFDALPMKKVRMRIHINRGEKLAGDSIFDKLDPYCIVKLGPMKKFQTPVQRNSGPNPLFDYHGVFTFGEEETLDITVMSFDKFSSDSLCGMGSIPVSELYEGFKGPIKLYRPRRGIFRVDDTLDPEPAGRVFVRITYDYERVHSLHKKPRSKCWPNQELFLLNEKACWGHEGVMLQSLFIRILEQATNNLPYALSLTNLRIVGAAPKGATQIASVWKASKDRFLTFVKYTGREKQFLQACRVSSLEKQTHIRGLVKRLIKKWEIEEETIKLRRGNMPISNAYDEEAVADPSKFRIAFRGYQAKISVRSAVNLTGGGLFDILDPYAVVRFRGSKQTPFKTSVLQDAGSDPVWNCEADLLYYGETALEISVWDYDKYRSDELIGTGVVPVEQFCEGFEGMVPLSLPNGKKKKTMKQMMIIIGIQWPALEDAPPALPDNSSGKALNNTVPNAANATWGTTSFASPGGNSLTNPTGNTLTGFSRTVA